MSAAIAFPGGRSRWPGARVLARGARERDRILAAVALLALTALAAVLRDRALSAHLWIDEGISYGIASHHLTAIPHVLRLDGSPPLFYLLLHGWIALAGRSEADLHLLPVIIAVAAVPAAYWAAAGTFGIRAGLCCAALVALSPYVGEYADELRMYSLVLLLGILTAGAFLRAYVERRRRWSIGFGVLLALLLYSHNWADFAAAALGLAWLGLLAAGPGRRELAIDGVVGFGLALVLFAPWVPTLLYQSAHTGAPWSHVPDARSLTNALTRMWSGRLPETIVLLIGGAGAVGLVRDGGPARRRGALALIAAAAVTLIAAYLWSRLSSPAWALRYLVAVLAPLLLVVGAGMARTGLVGVAAIVVVLLVGGWRGRPSVHTLEHKSDVAMVAHRVAADLPPGSLVFSPQPEQVPDLRYYLPPGLRYLTPLGLVHDTGVFDWRDAMARYDRARYAHVLAPAVRALPAGTVLLVAQPSFHQPDAPWTIAIRRDARRWRRALVASGLVRELASVRPARGYNRSTIQGLLFVKLHARHLTATGAAARSRSSADAVGPVVGDRRAARHPRRLRIHAAL